MPVRPRKPAHTGEGWGGECPAPARDPHRSHPQVSCGSGAPRTQSEEDTVAGGSPQRSAKYVNVAAAHTATVT